MEGYNAGNHHHEGNQYFEKARKQNTLLTFRQASGPESSLNHILIGTPVEKIGENHPGKKRGKRGGIVSRSDGVELLCICGHHNFQAPQNTALTQCGKPQKRHGNADDQQAQPVERI